MIRLSSSPSSSPCYQYFLPYHPDLAKTYFSQIQHQNWAMLLRSASPEHPDSRYDILVANPIATLLTHQQQTKVSLRSDQGVQHQYHNGDPFTVLQQYQDALLPKQASLADVPFIGGALGYFSYDLGRQIESLPQEAIHDIATADMAIGIYEWACIVDHHQQSAYLVGLNLEQHYDWLQQQQAMTTIEFQLQSDWQANMNREQYQQKFAAIQAYLQSGDCYQINLAQRFQACYQGSEWSAYQALEAANHAPFSAFIRTPELTVMSVSPERFLSLDHGRIETKPIKGTRKRGLTPEQDADLKRDLQSAPKDKSENLMIVDLLRNDIGKVALPGSVSVPKPFDVETFPAVHHLVSTIQAKLVPTYGATDLLKACFPGGSITGAPKIRAMEIIEVLEPHRRNLYCGSIGYISRCGKMDTNITIRTVLAYQDQLYTWAGGGIVADSQVDDEYQETLDKVSRILPQLKSTSL